MKAFRYTGTQAGLKSEVKTNWKPGKTNGPALFVHGGSRKPSEVKSGGFSPAHGREYLTDPKGDPISGGKMLFSFWVCDGFAVPASVRKPKAVGQFWGFDGHMYVFQVPVGTTFWCTNGTIRENAEVAFEYEIESSDIVEYWGPSNTAADFERWKWTSLKP